MGAGAQDVRTAPALTIIVPAYNAGAYLARTLESLLAQTLRDFELVCVDDGSTDNTAQVMGDYARRDPRIVCVRQPNGGAAAARNAGIDVARGEYLAILDSDDVYEPTMMQVLYERALATQADVVVCRCDDLAPDGTRRAYPNSIRRHLLPAQEPFAGTDIRQEAFMAFVGWSWDKLFRRDFVEEAGLRFQNLRTSNDMYFVFCAIARARSIATVDDVLVHHQRGAGGISTTRERSWTCFHDALMRIREQLVAWGLFEHYERDFVNYCLHASLWNHDTLDRATRKRLRRQLRESWLEEFGIAGRPMGYFYHKRGYVKLRLLMLLP